MNSSLELFAGLCRSDADVPNGQTRGQLEKYNTGQWFSFPIRFGRENLIYRTHFTRSLTLDSTIQHGWRSVENAVRRHRFDDWWKLFATNRVFYFCCCFLFSSVQRFGDKAQQRAIYWLVLFGLAPKFVQSIWIVYLCVGLCFNITLSLAISFARAQRWCQTNEVKRNVTLVEGSWCECR